MGNVIDTRCKQEIDLTPGNGSPASYVNLAKEGQELGLRHNWNIFR